MTMAILEIAAFSDLLLRRRDTVRSAISGNFGERMRAAYTNYTTRPSDGICSELHIINFVISRLSNVKFFIPLAGRRSLFRKFLSEGQSYLP